MGLSRRRLVGPIVTVLAALGMSAAHGKCSRPIRVPLAPMGQSVLELPQQAAGGAYPELLRRSEPTAGCQFLVETMPRARAEMLFQKASADLLLPASRTPRRDAIAEFVPLIQARPGLLYLPREGLTPPRSVQGLLESSLRVVLVRGYDYGPLYKDMEQTLQRQNRLILEPNPLGVARALATGLADVAVINRHHLHGLTDGDPRLQDFPDRLRSVPLDELPWTDSGLYLSTRSLSAKDRSHLRRVFEDASRNGLVWDVLTQHFPASALEGSMRPRER